MTHRYLTLRLLAVLREPAHDSSQGVSHDEAHAQHRRDDCTFRNIRPRAIRHRQLHRRVERVTGRSRVAGFMTTPELLFGRIDFVHNRDL